MKPQRLLLTILATLTLAYQVSSQGYSYPKPNRPLQYPGENDVVPTSDQATPCQQEELSPCRRIMSLLDNHHRSNVKNMRSMRINEEDEDDLHQQSQFDDFDDDIGGSSGEEHETHESMEEHHSQEEYSTSNGADSYRRGRSRVTLGTADDNKNSDLILERDRPRNGETVRTSTRTQTSTRGGGGGGGRVIEEEVIVRASPTPQERVVERVVEEQVVSRGSQRQSSSSFSSGSGSYGSGGSGVGVTRRRIVYVDPPAQTVVRRRIIYRRRGDGIGDSSSSYSSSGSGSGSGVGGSSSTSTVTRTLHSNYGSGSSSSSNERDLSSGSSSSSHSSGQRYIQSGGGAGGGGQTIRRRIYYTTVPSGISGSRVITRYVDRSRNSVSDSDYVEKPLYTTGSYRTRYRYVTRGGSGGCGGGNDSDSTSSVGCRTITSSSSNTGGRSSSSGGGTSTSTRTRTIVNNRGYGGGGTGGGREVVEEVIYDERSGDTGITREEALNSGGNVENIQDVRDQVNNEIVREEVIEERNRFVEGGGEGEAIEERFVEGGGNEAEGTTFTRRRTTFRDDRNNRGGTTTRTTGGRGGGSSSSTRYSSTNVRERIANNRPTERVIQRTITRESTSGSTNRDIANKAYGIGAGNDESLGASSTRRKLLETSFRKDVRAPSYGGTPDDENFNVRSTSEKELNGFRTSAASTRMSSSTSSQASGSSRSYSGIPDDDASGNVIIRKTTTRILESSAGRPSLATSIENEKAIDSSQVIEGGTFAASNNDQVVNRGGSSRTITRTSNFKSSSSSGGGRTSYGSLDDDSDGSGSTQSFRVSSFRQGGALNGRGERIASSSSQRSHFSDSHSAASNNQFRQLPANYRQLMTGTPDEVAAMTGATYMYTRAAPICPNQGCGPVVGSLRSGSEFRAPTSPSLFPGFRRSLNLEHL